MGYQDTLSISGKQLFFKDCEICGTVDFIFGNGLAVFQDCKIYARFPNNNPVITITAQSKNSQDQLEFLFIYLFTYMVSRISPFTFVHTSFFFFF